MSAHNFFKFSYLTPSLFSLLPFSTFQSCNTPFSGLAADGAKLAMWSLTRAGYHIVAFVHDEILIELPIGCDYTREARLIEDLMCSAMSHVCPGISVCECIDFYHCMCVEFE